MTIQDPIAIKQHAYREGYNHGFAHALGYIRNLAERGYSAEQAAYLLQSFLEADLVTWRNNLDSEQMPNFLKSKFGHEG